MCDALHLRSVCSAGRSEQSTGQRERLAKLGLCISDTRRLTKIPQRYDSDMRLWLKPDEPSPIKDGLLYTGWLAGTARGGCP